MWRSTPVVLLGLLLTAWGWVARRSPFDRSDVSLALSGLVYVVIIFLVGMTLGAKKFDRYLLPAYLALDIAAALGWYALAAFFWKKAMPGVLRFVSSLILVAAIGLQIFNALSTFPYYLSYYNPLMGGSRKAPQTMQIGWGEGLDQAARYLNQKPNAAKLKVITWYPSGCFSYFFDGAERTMYLSSDPSPVMWEKFITSDYAVIYIGQWQRELSKPMLEYVAKMEPEHSIWIDGLEYARIYKLP